MDEITVTKQWVRAGRRCQRLNLHGKRPGWWVTAIAGVGAAMLVTACSATSTGGAAGPASSSMPSATATSSPAIPCAQITALGTGLGRLLHAADRPGSATRITATVMSIRANLTVLGRRAGTFSGQETTLRNALGQVANDAHAVIEHPSPKDQAALITAVDELKSKVQPMIAEIKAVCPGA